MYKKANTINVSTQTLSNYIDGYDVYNSLLLNKLRDRYEEKEPYQITTNSYRPDLVAEDIYGDSGWMGLLMITSGLSLESFKKGAVIMIYPKKVLNEIIRSL